MLFDRDERLITPTTMEWIAAGRLIARAIQRSGSMEPRDHFPDVLIALIANRLGATIITDNVSDMRGWVRLGQLDARVNAPGA